MRFDRLMLRGLGPFTAEVALDLEALQGPLVAISGENGAGKSVLLEALAAACYRRTPTRGTLAELATTRDAYCEVRVTNGSSYVLRQTIDAHTGKGEMLVADATTGAAIVESGKRKDGDRWVAEHLPAPEVLYSSTFGAQGSGGFLDLDPTERKRVILRVLGHEHLEELARAAGEKARAAKGALDTCVARLGDEERRGDAVATAEQALVDAQASVEVAARALETRRVELGELQAGVASAEEGRRRYDEAAAQLRDLEAKLAAAKTRHGDLQTRKTNNEAVLAEGESIRAAAAGLGAAAQAIETHREAIAQLERQQSEAAQRAAAERQLADQAGSAATEARRRIDRLALILRDARDVEAAERELPAAAERERAKGEALDAQRARLTELQGARLGGKERRIEHLRTGLGHIAAGARTAAKLAQRHIDEDDAAVTELEELPGLIRDLESTVAAGAEELASLGRQRQNLERTAARREDLARARAETAEAQLAAEQQLGAERGSSAKAARLEEEAAALAKVAAARRDDLATAQRRRDELDAKARLLPRLDAAQARIDELRPQLVVTLEELQALAEQKLAAEGATAAEPPRVPDTREAEHQVKRTEVELRSAEAMVAVRQADVEHAQTRAARIVELAGERQRHEAELADWRLLERDLGRNGVQALELDAAGPEITDLANDLLHHCLGPRFSVRVESTRPSADGKKELEGCFVFVHDAQANREAEAKSFSGGERVLVGEAINLAVTMLGVRHAGMAQPTLIRDETGAALDAEKGRAYIAMLRRAADLVGAHRVLFVSHDEQLQEMADARVRVADGRVEVC